MFKQEKRYTVEELVDGFSASDKDRESLIEEVYKVLEYRNNIDLDMKKYTYSPNGEWDSYGIVYSLDPNPKSVFIYDDPEKGIIIILSSVPEKVENNLESYIGNLEAEIAGIEELGLPMPDLLYDAGDDFDEWRNEAEEIEENVYIIRGQGNSLKENLDLLYNVKNIHLFISNNSELKYKGQLSLCNEPERFEDGDCWIFPMLLLGNNSLHYVKEIDWNERFKEMLFPEVVSGLPYEKTVCLTNVQIDDEANGQYDKYTTLNVMTNEMLEVDNTYFRERIDGDVEEYIDYIYKPYMCSIVIDKESVGGDFIEQLKNTEQAEIIIRGGAVDPNFGYKATLFFAASPLEITDIQITAIKENKSIIEDIYNEYFNTNKLIDDWMTFCKDTKDPDINNKVIECLNDIFSSNSQMNIKVFTVGSANMIKVQNKSGGFYFDYGIPIPSILKEQGLPEDYFDFINDSKSELDYYIISHWHSDHFNGLFCKSMEFWRRNPVFIAPRWCKEPFNEDAKRMIAYLSKNDQLLLIDDEKNNSCFYENNNYRVCKGAGTDDNNTCILIQLNNTLLTGDCSVLHWPDIYGKGFGEDNNTYKVFKNIVGPHHCGKKSILNNVSPLNCKEKLGHMIDENTKVVFCISGNDKRFPDVDQINELLRYTEKIELTNKSYEKDISGNEKKYSEGSPINDVKCSVIEMFD